MTTPRITVKEAVNIAIDNLNFVYEFQPSTRPRLEETILDENHHWLITLSFTQPGVFDQREYKTFEIDAQNGRFIAMRIRQPSLIIHPLDDDFSAMSNATYLRDHLTGATELVVLDDCYHIVTVDRQRHLVVEAIDRFAQAFGSGATNGLVTAREEHQIAVA